jgi:hypothetical protein
MNAVYRSCERATRSHWERASARRREEIAASPEAPAAYGRRVGRIAAGIVLCAGASLIVEQLLGWPFGVLRLVFGGSEAEHARISMAHVLVGSWLAALQVYVLARSVAERRSRDRLEMALAPESDVARASERLERESPMGALRASIQRLEFASVALPLAGISLLAPLSLHLPFVAPDRVDEWIGTSGVIVGHVHAVLVVCAVLHAAGIRDHRGVELSRELRRSGWSALGFAIFASLVPGMFLLMIPTLLVAATGVVFIPVSFWATARAALRERALAGMIDPR